MAPHTPRRIARYVAGALFVLALAMASGPRHVDAQQEDLVAFGQEVAALLAQGDVSAVADLFVPTVYECPVPDGFGGTQPVCDGVDEGTTVEGVFTGRLGSTGGAIRLGDLPAQLAADAESFAGGSVRLYSVVPVAGGGQIRACESCSAFVVSTPESAADRFVLVFMARSADGEIRLDSYLEGLGDQEMISGGVTSGLTFIEVEPSPPQVGTGLREAPNERLYTAAPWPAVTTQDDELIAFGREIAILVSAGDVGGVTERFITTEFACPLATPGGVLPICECVADGDTVQGIPSGFFGTDAAVDAPPEFAARLRQYLDGFRGSEFQLYTIGESGWPVGVSRCTSCSAIVLSTAEEVTGACGANDSRDRCPTVAHFDVVHTGDGYALRALAVGSLTPAMSAMLEGGVVEEILGSAVDSQIFVAVDPTPPQVGTGLREPLSDRQYTTAAIATALIALGISIIGAAALRRARV